MTALNKAFIKAFAAQPQPPSAAAPASAVEAAPPAVVEASTTAAAQLAAARQSDSTTSAAPAVSEAPASPQVAPRRLETTDIADPVALGRSPSNAKAADVSLDSSVGRSAAASQPRASERILSPHAAAAIPAPHFRLDRGDDLAPPNDRRTIATPVEYSPATGRGRTVPTQAPHDEPPTAGEERDSPAAAVNHPLNTPLDASPRPAPIRKTRRIDKPARSSGRLTEPKSGVARRRRDQAAPTVAPVPAATPTKSAKSGAVKSPAPVAAKSKKQTRRVEALAPPPQRSKRRAAPVEVPKPARGRGDQTAAATSPLPARKARSTKTATTPKGALPPKAAFSNKAAVSNKAVAPKVAGPPKHAAPGIAVSRPKIAELLAAAERAANAPIVDATAAGTAARANEANQKTAAKRRVLVDAEEPREILPFKSLHATAMDHLFGSSGPEGGLLVDSDTLLAAAPSPLEASFAPAELMAFDEPLPESPISPASAAPSPLDLPQNNSDASVGRSTMEPQAPFQPSVEQLHEDPLLATSAEPATAAASPIPSSNANGEIRSLSNYVSSPPVQDAFCPRLEVERFLWPSTVQTLLTRVGPAIERFAAQLVADAARGEKTLAITGGGRSQGCTTLTLLLAKQVGLLGGRVIVVDADFQRPLVSRALGVDAPWGWDQAIAGEIPLDEAIITSLGDRVAMLPWNVKNVSPPAALDDFRAAACLGLLREHYDLVLVDAGPIPAVDGPSELRRLAGAARFDGCYVVHDGRATAPPLAEILSRAGGLGWRVFGVLENYSALASDESARPAAA